MVRLRLVRGQKALAVHRDRRISEVLGVRGALKQSLQSSSCDVVTRIVEEGDDGMGIIR